MTQDVIHTVTLPDIGEGVVEGEVIEWLKQEGDPLAQDEPVVIVMTDKATVELPAPHPGRLVKHYYAQGETAILDKPLYDIAVKRVEGTKDKHVNRRIEKVDVVPPTPPTSPKKEEKIIHRSGKALATPPVRQLAKEMDIDLSQVRGTGKDGRVTKSDLTQVKSTPALHLPDDQETPLIGVQALMAKRMAESKATIPHFSYYEKVEAARLIQLRGNVKRQGEKEGIHVTYVPFFIRALSLTAQKFPIINSSLDLAAQKVLTHQHHNIGVAMNSKHGLIVPVLKDVQEMSLREIIENYEILKEKALAGKLASSEMKEATLTLSNFGVLGGGLWATPIINPPEVAILAVNKIQKQAIIKGDQSVVEDILNLSWSFDHRIIDGDLAARVSDYFAKLIRGPAALL